jgi:aspartate kinase
MGLIVKKFGGTSVGDLDRIRNVANRIVKTYNEDNNVVIILSAMAGITDGLIDMAKKITPSPDKREMDVLLATGEQTSAALLSITLISMGYPATSLLGHQAEVMTNCAFGDARIIDVGASRIKEYINNRQIVIVAGFQGSDEEGNITTLGRGGSDTSAVAIAAAINADACEIYTDVDGIYTADPNICEKAKRMNKVSFDEMLEMASLGAKVLQIRSVELAKKYNVPIHVRSSFNEEEGTMVMDVDSDMESPVVSGVTHNKNEARITIKTVPDQPGVASKIF